MAIQFVPQTSSTTPDNVYTDPRYTSYAGKYFNMPNCVRYAYGRWWCILGSEPMGLYNLGNAESWFGKVTQFRKEPAGSPDCIPKLGAIICFADGPYSGLGHVAVVERIDSNGICHFSESNYRGAYFWYGVHKGNASNNYGFHYAYRFQGFIYLPTDYDPPGPGPGPGPDPDPPPYRPSQGNMFDSDFFLKYTKRRPF